MAKAAKKPVPMRSRKSGIKTMERIKKNLEVLKNVSNNRHTTK